MKKTFIEFLPYMIILLTLYSTALCIQWTFESKYTLKTLLEDIVKYDSTIMEEIKSDGNKNNIQNYADIFIEVENVNMGVWFSNWNVFDWGEEKYIYEKNRKTIFDNLNYWRETTKLPTMYNLDVKSVYNIGEQKCQNEVN